MQVHANLYSLRKLQIVVNMFGSAGWILLSFKFYYIHNNSSDTEQKKVGRTAGGYVSYQHVQRILLHWTHRRALRFVILQWQQ